MQRGMQAISGEPDYQEVVECPLMKFMEQMHLAIL